MIPNYPTTFISFTTQMQIAHIRNTNTQDPPPIGGPRLARHHSTHTHTHTLVYTAVSAFCRCSQSPSFCLRNFDPFSRNDAAARQQCGSENQSATVRNAATRNGFRWKTETPPHFSRARPSHICSELALLTIMAGEMVVVCLPSVQRCLQGRVCFE